MFQLLFTGEAEKQLFSLSQKKSLTKQFKAVQKTLGLMEMNLRHPSLNTHKYHSICGLKGEVVFESYAENKTPCAYRIFWHYGPQKTQLTIIAIIPHP